MKDQFIQPNTTAASISDILGLGAAMSQPKTLNLGDASIGSAPFIVAPKDFEVKDLSKYLPEPVRATGEIAFGDVQSFIRYVNKHKDRAGDASRARRPASGDTSTPPGEADKDDQQTIIMVDIINSKFRAVFNHHASDAPGWKDHSAAYNCPLSPEWKTWTGSDGKKFRQEEFAFFIEQNILDIHDPAGATMLEIVTTLKSKKNVHFDSGIRLNDGQVQLKYHEENNTTAGAAGQMTIPEKLKLGIPVYVGGVAYAVEAMFRYRIDGSNLAMWYDLIRPHKILEDALSKVVTQVEAGTGIAPYSTTSV